MFKLQKKLKNGVRVGTLKTSHGTIETPFFMPVGTAGSVKGVSPFELKELKAKIILGNTYHLYLRPGEELIKNLGGLHSFMNWNRPILTDSGGYQVFSLGRNNSRFVTPKDRLTHQSLIKNTKPSLVKITDEGVEFTSHLDGSKHLFTPEKVIQIQLDLGVDILMPLDVCPSGKATEKEIKEAVDLTIKWAIRSKKYFDIQVQKLRIKNKNHIFSRPLLHGIVQGGLDLKLRKYCADKLIILGFDGYSVGGLAVDYETRDMWKVVKLMGEILPEEKQRYLMGVGTPEDIIMATKLGMDMFDCVLPTRLARHGSVYRYKIKNHCECSVSEGFELINLLNSKYRDDPSVIDKDCKCPSCKSGFSLAYISHLLRSKEILGIRLSTLHNLFVYLTLMNKIRKG